VQRRSNLAPPRLHLVEIASPRNARKAAVRGSQ
jgi:hypothetical protein